MNKPKVIIVVASGLVQNIISDTEIKVMIFDHDIDGLNIEDITILKEMDGQTFKCYKYAHPSTTVNKEITEYYFNQAD